MATLCKKVTEGCKSSQRIKEKKAKLCLFKFVTVCFLSPSHLLSFRSVRCVHSPSVNRLVTTVAGGMRLAPALTFAGSMNRRVVAPSAGEETPSVLLSTFSCVKNSFVLPRFIQTRLILNARTLD